MSAAAETVLYRAENGVGWITLNRPDRLNAFAGDMRDRLHDALVRAGADPDARVVAITGAGRGFCAGADLEVTRALADAGDDAGFAALVRAGMRAVTALAALAKPAVAVVNGAAAGAGASLAAACDLRIASAAATVGFGFNRIGLHPDWGATYFLPRRVGAGRAAELILSGRTMDAAEAHAAGLFERVLPAEGFAEAARAEVEALAAKPPLALALAKRTLARSEHGTLDELLAAEAEAQAACFRSADAREGIAAFVEKRAPVFRGA